MKRKIVKFLLPLSIFLSFSGLVSCGPKPFTSKVKLDYGEIRENDLNSIDELGLVLYEDLQAKIYDKESFILLIKGTAGCSCWTDFDPTITKYINNTHVRTITVDYTAFINKDSFGLYTVGGHMPSIAIFNRGTLVYQAVHGRDNKKIFTDYQTLYEFMSSHTVLPKMYLITKTTLDTYFTSSKEFTLYIERSLCNDCSTVNREVLQGWQETIQDNPNNYLYIFDIQKYQGTEEYQTIKDCLGMSEEGDSTFGWGTGYIPTFQHRTGSTITDMIVVNNDTYNKDTKLISSYFTTSRVNNLSFLKNDETIKTKVLDGMQLDNYSKDEYIKAYHNPITKLFLNTYIK